MSHRKYTPEQEQEIVSLRQAGWSLPALMRKYGGALPAMRGCLRRNGVPRLQTGRPRWRDFTPEQVSEMAAMWEAGESQRAIALRFQTTQHIVSRLLGRLGFTPEHRRNIARGERHGMWNGGRIMLHGYVAVKGEDSPYRAMANGGGYILEHRLVMATALGRDLLSTETIHHINGDRLDNRLENLQLRQGKHGRGTVMRCLECGSANVGTMPLADTLA